MPFFTDDVLTTFSTELKREQSNYFNGLALLNKNKLWEWLIKTRSLVSTPHPRPAKPMSTTSAPAPTFDDTQINTFVKRLE